MTMTMIIFKLCVYDEIIDYIITKCIGAQKVLNKK
jgi:hypothetical protein